MDKLKDIARLLKKKKLKSINTFFNKNIKSSNAQKLFKGIMEEKYQTDSQASFDIFGEKIPSKKYRELKNYVKDDMLNTILSLDISINASDRLKATYKCEKYLFIGKMLMKNGYYKAGYDILKRCLILAKKYKITEVILSALKYISGYHLILANEKALNKVLREINFYKEIYSAELLSSEYLCNLRIKGTNSKSLKPDLAKSAEICAKRIKNYIRNFKEYNSLTLRMNYFKVKSIALESKGDFYKVIKLYSEIEIYFLENVKIISPFQLSTTLLNKLLCYAYLQDYRNGLFLAERISQILPKNSVNYIFYLNHYFLLTIQSNKLEHSLEILNEIKNHKMFYYHQFEQEIFILFKSYLIFALLSCNDTKQNQIGINLRKNFNVFNEITKLKKLKSDTKGLNVSILIIQFLFNLLDNNYDPIIKDMESLKQYSFRHLRKNDYYRMDCFIKLLLQIHLSEFNLDEIKGKTNINVKKLKSFRGITSNSFYNWEIIPYEDLWEKILKLLNGNMKSPKNSNQ